MKINTLRKKFFTMTDKIGSKKNPEGIPHRSTQFKGYLDYFDGLWVNGWVAKTDGEIVGGEYKNCSISLNEEKVLDFVADIQRDDLLGIPELKYGKGFSVQIPIKPCVEQLKNSEQLEVKVSVDGVEISHSLKINKIEFYKNLTKSLCDDINYYISFVPAFNEDSIHYLTEWNKLYLLDALFQTGLYKELKILVELVIGNMHYDANAGEQYNQLLDKIRFNQDFIALFLRQTGNDFFKNSLSGKVVEALCHLPYLQARDLINSHAEPSLKSALISDCTGSESRKFEFIENFPSDQIEGLKLWNNLTESLKKDYWPLLAGALQYQNRHNELKLITCNPSWYLAGDQHTEDKNEALRYAVNNKNNDWFALSFVTQALETNRHPLFVATLLKEYAWKIWQLNYFDTDGFCYIAKKLLDVKIDKTIYTHLIDAFDNVLRFKISHDINGLHRETFQITLAKVINEGITSQYHDFIALEQTARPALALSEAYTETLELNDLEACDYNIYREYKHFYNRVNKVKTFFTTFDSTSSYSNEQLAGVIPELMTLKRDFDVRGIDQYFLALSRYIQLTNRTGLYDLLKAIHSEIGDTYSALQLEQCPEARKELMREITEHGDKARRSDSYWFKAALKARATDGHQETIGFIERLSRHLNTAAEAELEVNLDLVELLVSEVLWLAKHAVIDELTVQQIETVASSKKPAAWLKLQLFIALQQTGEQEANIDLIHNLSDQLGGIANLSDILEELNSALSGITNTTGRNEICQKITESSIYPYLKVMVYSCNKYESTRHQIIRDTWLNDLNQYGIDYAFIVGDAEKAYCDQDKICLDVPDTYEELPRKSLRMFEFAAQSSNHQYYYKLDDDCVLNTKAMFGDPAFLHYNFFGRIVRRGAGGVDRSWHHKKSTTEAAKKALDLSPELSVYCDGGTGYILSRYAIEQMIKSARSPGNQRLVDASYYEDKLVGDLLALNNIEPIEKGYNCVVRRNVANGRDVQVWDYGLLPNAVTNIKVLHTEDDDFRRSFYKQLHDEWSLKIPNLIYRDITSDMSPKWLGDSEEPVLKAYRIYKKAIEKASVIAIIVGKNEQEFLPNLLEHHRKLGVEHFMFVDNASSDSSIDYMLNQQDVSVFIATQDYKYARFGVNWQETLCQHFCLGKWTLIIDSDELFMFDGFENHSIQELVKKADEERANAILSPMVDFYPKGSLDSADITVNKPFYETCNYFDSPETMSELTAKRYGPFSNSKVYSAGIRERIFGRYNAYPAPNYLNQKYNLIKYNPGMRLIEGLHFMASHKPFSKQCGIMHFKYHSGFHAKVMREVESGQHWNGATEYRRYLELFKTDTAKQLYNENISIKFSNSSCLVKTDYISDINW